MDFLLLMIIPTAAVWGLVAWDRQQRSTANLLPLLALAVVVAGSVFGYEFFHLAGGPIPITLDRILLVGLICLGLVCYLRGTEDLQAINRSDILVLALVGINGWSAVTHDWRFMDNMPASRLLFFYLVPLALYLVVRTMRLEESDLKWISLGLASLGIYLALTAIAEVLKIDALVFPRYIMNASEVEFLGRGRGPFLNPIANGIFQTVCLCCVWMWWPQTGRLGKCLLVGLTLVMAAGIFCTLTRSIWMGLIAGAAIFIFYPADRQLKGLMIVVAVVATLVAFPLVGDKVFSFKRDEHVSQAEMEKSAALRPLFAMVAWEMVQDRPIFGCGFGQYAREKYPYLQDPHSGQPLSNTKRFMQHNVFLAYACELGLVGVAILLALLGTMAFQSWQLWKHGAIYWHRVFGLLTIVMLVNYTLNGMLHDVSIVPMQNMLLLFLFGLVNNLQLKVESRESRVQSGGTRAERPESRAESRRLGVDDPVSPKQ